MSATESNAIALRPPAEAPLRCRGASVEQIEALYRARAHAFVRFAAASLDDRELAADVVQEAFAQALRRRERFRGDGALEAWLWSAVVNTARNAARSRAVRRRYDREQERSAELAHHVGPEQLLHERARSLRDTVSQLPERQRMCVFLRYFADLDYAGIAAALQISEGTVAATLNAARRRLREQIEPEGQAG